MPTKPDLAPSQQDLDLTKDYWQVTLASEAKPKTAFSTASSHWQYRVLTFGLHGMPATFQHVMYIVLRLHCQFASAYLDDVIIYFSTWAPPLEKTCPLDSSLAISKLAAG